MPVMLIEVLPGDSMTLKSQILLRWNTLVRPPMQYVAARLHYWYVPNRIVWPEPNGWETFITDADSGLNVPTIAASTVGS